MVDWGVRRGLRRLIGGGYVFSPERGRYRITALGVTVLAPLPELGQRVPGEAATTRLPASSTADTVALTGPADETRGRLYARMRRRR
jgi:hypothetical protein